MQRSFTRHGLLAILLAVCLGALVFPGIASAASFGTFVPAPAATLAATPSRISANFYDARGVRGSGVFSMYVDGVRVPAKLTYKVVRGRRDYRRGTIWYVPAAPLAPGSHSVYVRVRNTLRRAYSRTWGFAIVEPPAPRVPMPVSQIDCTGCHIGYPTTHPMTACLGCHDAAGPIGGGYSASTLPPHPDPEPSVHKNPASCAGAGCHVGQLSADCASCHSGRYPAIPVSHDLAKAPHLAQPSSCSTCHDDTLTVEHYKTRRLVCASCHSSINAVVKAAVAADAPACAGCHIVDADGIPHTARLQMPVTGTACGDCHVGYPTTHPMTACLGCHDAAGPIGGGYSASTLPPHPDPEPSVHKNPASCAGAGCHTAQLSADCASCHSGRYPAIPTTHSLDVSGYHVAPTTECRPCHDQSLTVEHYRQSHAGVRFTCAICHESTVPAVRQAIAAKDTSCAACHPEKPNGHVPSIR